MKMSGFDSLGLELVLCGVYFRRGAFLTGDAGPVTSRFQSPASCIARAVARSDNPRGYGILIKNELLPTLSIHGNSSEVSKPAMGSARKSGSAHVYQILPVYESGKAKPLWKLVERSSAFIKRMHNSSGKRHTTRLLLADPSIFARHLCF